MATFKKYEIGESYSVVLDIGSRIPSDHLCKQMESIVSKLDTSCIEANYSSIGQNALPPKLLLSIIFYGYATGIRSGRKLSKACEESLPFIYLSKGYFPKKTVINDFRKENYHYFSGLFVQVLERCMEAEQGDPATSIIDGSKLESNSSKRRTKSKEQFEKWQAHLLEDITSLESTLEKLPLDISQDDSQDIKKN